MDEPQMNSDLELGDRLVENELRRRRTSLTSRSSDAEPQVSQRSQHAGGLDSNAVEGGPLEVDTCRICRAEGTAEEPLFYPCKCSGSIKYVHQNCLMEWLSHSQKKHCELCKTSFRFTKLYSPSMPSRLPWLVFATHAVRYVANNVLVWMRALLVGVVWLAWLPFCMRMIWSSGFWLSEFGFGGSTIFGYMPNPSLDNSAGSLASSTRICMPSVMANVCPANPFVAALDCGTCVQPRSPTATSIEPSLTAYMRLVLAGLRLVDHEYEQSESLGVGNYQRSRAPEHISLLSEVRFLRRLTRNLFINNAVISVLEGLIITVLVVLCFVLVILVRDYVVQQQPDINMRAFAAQAPAVRLPQRPLEAPDAALNADGEVVDNSSDATEEDNDSQLSLTSDEGGERYDIEADAADSESDSSDDDEATTSDLSEQSLISLDEVEVAAMVARRRVGEGLINKVIDFLWGRSAATVMIEARLASGLPLDHLPLENAAQDPEEERLGEADENVINENGNDEPGNIGLDGMAELDQDAIEDAEDFEGLMELFGMRGPLFGLFQNALFCALLVFVTVILAVFLPYNIGRVALWLTANPHRAFRSGFMLVQFLVDGLLAAVSGMVAFAAAVVHFAVGRFDKVVAPAISTSFNQLWNESWSRMAKTIIAFYELMAGFSISGASAASNVALSELKELVSAATAVLAAPLVLVIARSESERVAAVQLVLARAAPIGDKLSTIFEWLAHPRSWLVASLPHSTPLRQSLPTPLVHTVYWNSWDRFIAIVYGYMVLAAAASLYLVYRRRRMPPVTVDHRRAEWDDSVVEGLNQASGVMKVILIISIEMLIFPLYCGWLLDVALMPLFADATVESRLMFTARNPATSLFVHWFVGTGYMFHLALFVSMCRKIMRKGLLYFIKDPDEPEFHPVRDVLERTVVGQLRKIMFAAVVYGGLVLVCLGGVVWGLSIALPKVLPIHFSSTEPFLESPTDLLFYNSFLPHILNVLRPSSGLQKMYTWWFHQCGRILRLTWFLVGQRKIDEEGTLKTPADSPYWKLPFWKKLFIQHDPETGNLRQKPWTEFFSLPERITSWGAMSARERTKLTKMKERLVASGQLVPNGRFVRTPASDQVKIPKGQKVFLEVDEQDNRITSPSGNSESDIYDDKTWYEFVYIPPLFRVRIFLLVVLIWLFAAVTGIAMTIVPLAFGRWLFRMWLPPYVRTNDVYAFSMGFYLLGLTVYGVVGIKKVAAVFWQRVRGWWQQVCERSWTLVDLKRVATDADNYYRIQKTLLGVFKAVYCYTVIFVAFPLLLSAVIQLYIMMPLRSCMYLKTTGYKPDNAGVRPLEGDSAASTDLPTSTAPYCPSSADSTHSIRIMEAWTLGLVCLNFITRLISVRLEGTRLAGCLRAITRRGWHNPDAVALTRGFVLPAVLVSLVVILGPFLAARKFVDWISVVTPQASLAQPTINAGPPMLVTNNNIVTPPISSSVHGGPRSPQQNQPVLRADVVVIYRWSYPLSAFLTAGCIATFRVCRIFSAWKSRIRDEAYLVGEQLHNFRGATTSAGVAYSSGGGTARRRRRTESSDTPMEVEAYDWPDSMDADIETEVGAGMVDSDVDVGDDMIFGPPVGLAAEPEGRAGRALQASLGRPTNL